MSFWQYKEDSGKWKKSPYSSKIKLEVDKWESGPKSNHLIFNIEEYQIIILK